MTALGVVLGGLLPTAALIWLLTHPDLVEKWASLLSKAASYVPGLWSRGTRQYLKIDTERRINAFTRRLADQGTLLSYERAEVQWVEADSDFGAMAAQGRVIVRLKREDQAERGFLRGALLFVSKSFLGTAKRPMSPEQTAALDTFVTRELIRREHPQLLEIFDDEVVGETEKLASSKYYDRFALLSARGLFWDVFAQEILLLSQHLSFTETHSDRADDIDGLLEFLCARAQRAVGDLVKCEYLTDVFRLALVYVGLADKVQQGGGVWSKYIRSRLIPLSVDSVYLISRSTHESIISEVAEDLSDHYSLVNTATRTYSLRRGPQLHEVDGLIGLFRASRLSAPAVAGILDGIDDGAVFDAVDNPFVPHQVSPADVPVPEGAVETEVVTVLGRFGFLKADGFDRVYFKTEWISPLALPVHVGQRGTARLEKSEDGRIFARGLRFEPPAVRWVGRVTGFQKGHGRIMPEGICAVVASR